MSFFSIKIHLCWSENRCELYHFENNSVLFHNRGNFELILKFCVVFRTEITTCVGGNTEVSFITLIILLSFLTIKSATFVVGNTDVNFINWRTLVSFFTVEIIPYVGGNTDVNFITWRILVSFFTIEIMPYVGEDTEVTLN